MTDQNPEPVEFSVRASMWWRWSPISFILISLAPLWIAIQNIDKHGWRWDVLFFFGSLCGFFWFLAMLGIRWFHLQEVVVSSGDIFYRYGRQTKLTIKRADIDYAYTTGGNIVFVMKSGSRQVIPDIFGGSEGLRFHLKVK